MGCFQKRRDHHLRKRLLDILIYIFSIFGLVHLQSSSLRMLKLFKNIIHIFSFLPFLIFAELLVVVRSESLSVVQRWEAVSLSRCHVTKW